MDTYYDIKNYIPNFALVFLRYINLFTIFYCQIEI